MCCAALQMLPVSNPQPREAVIEINLQGLAGIFRWKSGNKAARGFPGRLWMLCRIVCWFNAHSGGSVLLAWRRENL